MDSPTPYLRKFLLKMFIIIIMGASLNGKCHFGDPSLRDSVKRQGIDLESQNIYIFRIYLSLVAEISEMPKCTEPQLCKNGMKMLRARMETFVWTHIYTTVRQDIFSSKYSLQRIWKPAKVSSTSEFEI